MRLDRNTKNGRGKYALIKLRTIDSIKDASHQREIVGALDTLSRHNLLHFGNENDGSPGEQFFVIKYSDLFAAPALRAYADAADGMSRAVEDTDVARDLREWAFEIREEAFKAELVGGKIPD